jgi:hypothetical protein
VRNFLDWPGCNALGTARQSLREQLTGKPSLSRL